jgi:hypothetical protein
MYNDSMKEQGDQDRRIVVTEWDRLEDRYRQNLYNGLDRIGEIDQRYADGPLLLCAAHSLNHYRDGNVKLADRWTGSAVEILASSTQSGYIIPTGKIVDWESWDKRSDPFKLAIDARAIAGTFVLDFHGMSNTHGVDLCVGLGPAPGAVATRFADHLTLQLDDYKVSLNTPFSAEPSFTVTAYVQQHTKADAVQLEIAARLRDPRDHAADSTAFMENLSAAIRDFDI